ncbi:hypothetical protein GO755_29660 [Spirosoma sp. HMF4905]|uniref:Uncharacterized protein n=1 Tax=Spirosoma arboris TaxID=2682092 RepID=A0A7K1SKF0_9BACT|nr:hypothetical protein [Spirosoma arboris]MVM34234.1 hypothetical protein [Spirosoma arboris]
MARYEIRKKDGVTTYYPETGQEVFEGTPTTVAPTGTTPAYLASRVGKLYTPEAAKRTLNLVDIGGSKSLFFFSSDAREDEKKHAAWLSAGAGRISQWSSNESAGSRFSDLPDGKKFVYQTQSSLPGEGFWWWAMSVVDFEQGCINMINAWPAGVIWTANIETNNYWQRFYHGDDSGAGNIGHYPPWPEIKGVRIQMESQPGSMTVEELFANPGLQAQEVAVRRSNRFAIMLDVAGRGGADRCFGSTPYQGDPGDQTLTSNTRFLDEADINLNNVGGSNGTIVLNGRTYTNMNGSFWKKQTVNLDYFYYFGFLYDGVYVDASIFENSAHPYHTHTNYPDLYAHMSDGNIVAREIGHWLGVQKRLADVNGGNPIPSIRMTELHYEGNFSRVPNGFGLSGTFLDGGSPKVWITPVSMENMYKTYHFLEGEREKSGFHVFYAAGAPNQGIIYNKDSIAYLNHAWHTHSQLWAARRDMETILDKIANSTLTTDIDIKVGNTGDFQRLNGVSAWNQNKPCAATRHKTTSEGTAVLGLIGFGQDSDTTRTDVIQIPGLSGNMRIQCTYKGPQVFLFECLFPNGVTNQTIIAQSIIASEFKPGYGGRINQ